MTEFLPEIVPNPESDEFEILGVPVVANPDWFDFSPDEEGNVSRWTRGFQTLPDGAITPLARHMGMWVADNGDLFLKLINPFTLLHIPRSEFEK